MYSIQYTFYVVYVRRRYKAARRWEKNKKKEKENKRKLPATENTYRASNILNVADAIYTVQSENRSAARVR